MPDFIIQLIPNVVNKTDELWGSLWQTFVMLGISGIISFSLGLVFGVCLIVTKADGVMPNFPVHRGLGLVINLFRSIPFVILLAALIPHWYRHRYDRCNGSSGIWHGPFFLSSGGNRSVKCGCRTY